ncbi:hypothetical protein BDV29DRAFT_167264 [Aspergillus leporis]|jgi:hypothetical protein|uniref:Secreted protein n=1 Tax=Aspergillus leporis TaxID=41062 RepID=A0A5N5XBN5_9EURO|nr:hypothetical protein BDV29DRAFT_167264 [Aspergillus leporis]
MKWASNLFASRVLVPLLQLLVIIECLVTVNSPASTHLSALTLQTTNALLSPLSSHLRRVFETVKS